MDETALEVAKQIQRRLESLRADYDRERAEWNARYRRFKIDQAVIDQRHPEALRQLEGQRSRAKRLHRELSKTRAELRRAIFAFRALRSENAGLRLQLRLAE